MFVDIWTAKLLNVHYFRNLVTLVQKYFLGELENALWERNQKHMILESTLCHIFHP